MHGIAKKTRPPKTLRSGAALVFGLQPPKQSPLTARVIMSKRSESRSTEHVHGPENADYELRKAYNLAVEVGTTYALLGERRHVPGVHAEEVRDLYKHAFKCHRDGDRLAAERWARTVKHLARAFWHEAKIAYLEAHATDLPFLEGRDDEAYGLNEREDTTADLLDSVVGHVPPGFQVFPHEMRKYEGRAREHLDCLKNPDYRNELLRAERIKAAHEYGRVLECMALAYEAENAGKKRVA
jgi:hypothetical protein